MGERGGEANKASGEKLGDFYKELEQLLKRQLEAEPGLDDVRVKLIELYFDQQRSDDFVAAAVALRRRIKDLNASRDWQRVASMGRMLRPGEALFSGAETDRIEYIGGAGSAPPKEPDKIRRFGDDDRSRPLFEALGRAYEPVRKDPKFVAEHDYLLVSLGNRRPTPLIHCARLSPKGGAQIYVKREDLAGDAPHLTVALTGQALLARKLGRTTLAVGSADGRRGVIAASVAARLGMKLVVYVDGELAERNSSNLQFMRLMGAEVVLAKALDYRHKDVREAALGHWHRDPENTFLLTGLDAAPPPYPVMTQEFVAAIGRETRRQFMATTRKLPDAVIARGSQTADALGLFPAFLPDSRTRLVAVEPEAAPATDKRQEDFAKKTGLTPGERKVAKNILERLEYPSVAREHAMYKASGRVEYVTTTRKQARDALLGMARQEGLIPAIETAHVLGWALKEAATMSPEQTILVLMMEGQGKDSWDIGELLAEK